VKRGEVMRQNPPHGSESPSPAEAVPTSIESELGKDGTIVGKQVDEFWINTPRVAHNGFARITRKGRNIRLGILVGRSIVTDEKENPKVIRHQSESCKKKIPRTGERTKYSCSTASQEVGRGKFQFKADGSGKKSLTV